MPRGETWPPSCVRQTLRGGNLLAIGRQIGFAVVPNLVAPILLSSALRAVGARVALALIAGAAVPALIVAVSIVCGRRLDGLAVGMMSVMLLAAGASLLSGGDRFLLAKDGWLPAVLGGWFLVSLWGGRPLAFLICRPVLEGWFGASWESLWEWSPRFRRIWRVSSAAWGAGLLLDGILRMTMAYTLPVDRVPGLSGALWATMFLLLQAITNVYYCRAGLWRLLRGERFA